jgi:hypothetical protein
MAKRKSYRGTPDEHRQLAVDALRITKQKFKHLNDAIRAGRCSVALAYIPEAAFFNGVYRRERSHAGKKSEAARLRMYAKMDRTLNAFAAKCLR